MSDKNTLYTFTEAAGLRKWQLIKLYAHLCAVAAARPEDEGVQKMLLRAAGLIHPQDMASTLGVVAWIAQFLSQESCAPRCRKVAGHPPRAQTGCRDCAAWAEEVAYTREIYQEASRVATDIRSRPQAS